MMGTARCCIRFMVDINVQGEVSGTHARARVTVMYLESCRGRVLVRLD